MRIKPLEGYVSTDEASAMTGLCTLTIRRYVESGRLPGGKVGSAIAVERAAVEQLARERFAQRRWGKEG